MARGQHSLDGHHQRLGAWALHMLIIALLPLETRRQNNIHANQTARFFGPESLRAERATTTSPLLSSEFGRRVIIARQTSKIFHGT